MLTPFSRRWVATVENKKRPFHFWSSIFASLENPAWYKGDIQEIFPYSKTVFM
jgi:hypothetical protein